MRDLYIFLYSACNNLDRLFTNWSWDFVFVFSLSSLDQYKWANKQQPHANEQKESKIDCAGYEL